MPRPGYVPTANGCGPDGWDWFVPDSWKQANFTKACSRHDICYGTCNSDRNDCDYEFLANLKKACRRAYGSKEERDLYHRCRDRTYNYYTAVSDGGQAAYEAAQEEACECCEAGATRCGAACCPEGKVCANQATGDCCSPEAVCGDECCPTSFCYECVQGSCRYQCQANEFCFRGQCQDCGETGCGG